MAKRRRLQYLAPDATMTLAEGIRELRAAEGAEGNAAEHVADDLVADLEVHDAIHVLFACPTNLAGEINAHLWTLFGTTVRMRDMHRVNMHRDHRQVLSDIGHAKLLWTWLKNFPNMIATLCRAIRMTRKWPAEDYDEYLDVPLVELRREFNIRLPRAWSDGPATGTAGAALRHVRKHGSAAQPTS